MTTDQNWYIGNQGQTIGPMSRAELASRLGEFQGPETLVYGPGGYKFSDFLRVGIPLNLSVGLLASFLIPILWPL